MKKVTDPNYFDNLVTQALAGDAIACWRLKNSNHEEIRALHRRLVPLVNSDKLDNQTLALLAMMYVHGLGVNINYKIAIDHCNKIIGNNTLAMCVRAHIKIEHESGDKSYAQAVALYEHAIRLNDPNAMIRRAYLHMSEHPENWPPATALLKRAANLGHPEAMFALANSPDTNDATSLALFEKASQLDYEPAILAHKIKLQDIVRKTRIVENFENLPEIDSTLSCLRPS